MVHVEQGSIDVYRYSTGEVILSHNTSWCVQEVDLSCCY